MVVYVEFDGDVVFVEFVVDEEWVIGYFYFGDY